MNTIVLMGRLARDPETKLTSTQKGQTKVSRFPLVVKRNRTSKAFVVMITAYGNNAEFVEKYLEKVFSHKSCPPIEMAFLVQVLLVYRMESSSSLLVEIRQILLFLFWLLQTLHYP